MVLFTYMERDSTMLKLNDEELENIKYMCLDDSTKVIQYLENKFEEQDKANKIDRIIAIIGAIFAALAVIVPFFI